jgi:hypothetical protein
MALCKGTKENRPSFPLITKSSKQTTITTQGSLDTSGQEDAVITIVIIIVITVIVHYCHRRHRGNGNCCNCCIPCIIIS